MKWLKHKILTFQLVIVQLMRCFIPQLFNSKCGFFCLTILIDWQSVKIDICNEFIVAPPNKRL